MTTIAPMRLAASLLATSSKVALGLAVVTARPFCLRIEATFMTFLPSAHNLRTGCSTGQAPSLSRCIPPAGRRAAWPTV